VNRRVPICFAYHKEYGYVPIVDIKADLIVWDDDQTTRDDPPENCYEQALPEEFDFTMPIYQKDDVSRDEREFQALLRKFAGQVRRKMTERKGKK
jgi:hypothetical protein